MIRDFEMRISSLMSEMDTMKSSSGGQLAELQGIIAEHECTIANLSNKIKLLLVEIDNLNQLLRQRLRDAHEWQNRFMKQEYELEDMKAEHERFRQMEVRLNGLQQLNEDQRLRITNLEYQSL
jgi:uncharacterized coiled-coil protein SlyX